MFGFGTKMNQVFASRWKAVTWSLGILLTAYCTVPVAEQTREHAAAKPPPHHRSAWDRDDKR